VKRRHIQWRNVIGAFQISIPLRTKDDTLAPEEQLLSVLKWIELSIPAADRWYLVFKRYVSQEGQRVEGLGGNPGRIEPSPIGQGQPTQPQPPIEILKNFTGKVSSLIFDRFGDFHGFELETKEGIQRLVSHEKEIEVLINRVWRERIHVTVVAETRVPLRPLELIFREPLTALRY